MMWYFLPRLLSWQYRVCSYDRRGYGWSETFEHDNPLQSARKRQRAANNINFLYALVEDHISKPFYYAGHSYGAHHLTLMALEHPDLIKGLIFLDGAEFSPVDTLRSMMELVANVQHAGFLRAGIDSGIINYRKLYADILDFTNLPPDIEAKFIATLKSGYYFATYVREKGPLADSDLAFKEVRQALQASAAIYAPVLVIDAGSRENANWFPKEHFMKYNESYHVTIQGATHESLVMSMRYAAYVSDLIDTFIKAHA